MRTSAFLCFCVLACSCETVEYCCDEPKCAVTERVDRIEEITDIELPYTPTELAAKTNGTYTVTLPDGTEIAITLEAGVADGLFDDCEIDCPLCAGSGNYPWLLECKDPKESQGGLHVRIEWDRVDLPGWGPANGEEYGRCQGFYMGAGGHLFLDGRQVTFTSAMFLPPVPFVYFDDRDTSWYMCSNGEGTEIWADSSQFYLEPEDIPPTSAKYIDVSNCLKMVKQVQN